MGNLVTKTYFSLSKHVDLHVL